MCNSVPVRNWLTALGIIIAAAITSAMLAIALATNLPPPLLWIAAICFTAAAAWCAIGVAMLFFLSQALNTYCTCIEERGGNRRCLDDCVSARSAINTIGSILIGGCILCAMLALMLPVVPPTFLFVILAILGSLLLIFLAIAFTIEGRLETCQEPATPPT